MGFTLILELFHCNWQTNNFSNKFSLTNLAELNSFLECQDWAERMKKKDCEGGLSLLGLFSKTSNRETSFRATGLIKHEYLASYILCFKNVFRISKWFLRQWTLINATYISIVKLNNRFYHRNIRNFQQLIIW